MVSRELRMSISHLSYQGLCYREIGRKTGLDRRTVKRYAEDPELRAGERAKVTRPSKLDRFRPMIEAWLREDPRYRATWVRDQLRKAGYDGGYSIVRSLVSELKEESSRIAYLRFETEPGRQAQVDFGEFKVVDPEGGERTYYLFSMVLGYSRQHYGEFLTRCDMVSFLDAHQRAFAAFGGVPAEVLYDRMRNVFLRKLAGKAEFTQGLLTLADHYGFLPRVAPAYAPWVKGKVERPMDFVREGFWRGYRFVEVEAANRDLGQFLEEKATRIHGTTGERVCDRFQVERPFLQPLPLVRCDVSERIYRKVHKDCTLSFEGSRYQVPHTLVGTRVLIRFREGVLRIFAEDRLVATHVQAARKGQLVLLPGLREAILADRELAARKYASPAKGKAKGTLGPPAGKYEVAVERRPLSVYGRIGGEVAHA
jgi:transposase